MIEHTTIKDHPELLDELLFLIESGFEYRKEHSYKIDFSPLFERTNWKNLHLLVDSEKIIAHVGAISLCLNNGSPVLFLGGIAVHKDYRGRGHFKDLLDSVLKRYINSHSLILLWSDLDEVYKKFGFSQAGSIIQTGSDIGTERLFTAMGFSKVDQLKLNSTQKRTLSRCFDNTISSNFLTTHRSDVYWEKILKISSADLYVSYNKKNEIDFYFFYNRGMDLRGIIHEFAGGNHLIIEEKLIKLKNFRVWLPKENPWIKEEDSYSSLYMGLFKIGNPSLFKELIQKEFSQNLIILNMTEETVTFCLKDKEYSISTLNFLSFLLGPNNQLLKEEKNSLTIWPTCLDSI